MERVRFCRNCGKVLEEKWRHCPWCGDGTPREELSWEEKVDDSLRRTEEAQMEGRFRVLDELSGRLDALETELDAFLSTRT